MRTALEDWKNGWYGVELALSANEIDVLIERLQMHKVEPDQHFHLTSDYRGGGGVGNVTVYLQLPSEPSNMEAIGSKAFGPGDSPVSPGRR